MRSVVIGAGGFLGRHLVWRLEKTAVSVVAFGLRRDILSRLFHESPISTGDARKPREVAREADGADVIFLCAGIPFYRRGAEKENLAILEGVMEGAGRVGCRVVAVSSPLVFDRPFTGPLQEGHRRRQEGELGVLAAWEDRAWALARTWDVGFTLLRLPALLGPYMHFNLLLDPIRRSLEGKTLRIIGNEKAKVAFLHVRDAARALELAGKSRQAVGKVYNVPGFQPITLKEWAHLTARLGGRGSRAVKVSSPLERILDFLRFPSRELIHVLDHDLIMDGTSMEMELGFRPEISYEDALGEIIAWLESDDPDPDSAGLVLNERL